MSTPPLLKETRGQVLWLTLNRPDRLNALNAEIVDALSATFSELAREPEIRIVVLRAAGRAFCAGLDLADTTFGDGMSSHGVYAVQKRIGDIYRAMRRCPQPVVALVQGAACGGGFSLALAADMRIAGESARMNAAYITAGLSACDMGCSYFLPRLVGVSIASELMMTGNFIAAERALRTGLVSSVVPDADLEVAAQPYLDAMLRTSPMGLRLTKDALNLNIDAPSLEAAMAIEDRQQALVAMTADAAEAQRAFLEKRGPAFEDH